MINKVLAIFLDISGLFDSKSIVKEVVWRKTTNKGGGRLLIQGGDYIYMPSPQPLVSGAEGGGRLEPGRGAREVPGGATGARIPSP